MRYLLTLSKPFPFAMLLASLVMIAACRQKRPDDSERNSGRTLDYTQVVTFLNAGNEPVGTVEVALADEPSERNMGLMDVTDLPADKGMLFIFEDDEPRSFWMANTPLSLDIIFVNADMEIVRIHNSTRPFSENNFTSGAPARYVVEVNGGYCVSHDIQQGMKIRISDSNAIGKTP